MNELDTMQDFPILEDDDGLDIAAIFGDGPSESPPGEAAVPNLFGEMTPKPAEQAPKQAASQAKKSLFDKPPVFSYGGAKEEIADAGMTFEELRIQKADDFPELEEGKSVSWRVRYGTAAKSISDPKGTTILQTKQEIERSKAFLDSLKKGKDKDPVCLVTPSVTAKSKGIAAYKGMFPSLETARASDKVICLIPAQDGQVYELRKHELGEFIAPKHNITELSEIRAGFRPALPLIPGALLGQIISFFRCFMGEKQEYEALVQIYWDREAEEFIPFVPKPASAPIWRTTLCRRAGICTTRTSIHTTAWRRNSPVSMIGMSGLPVCTSFWAG